MKDNTLIYVGLGLAAVYILSKRTTTLPLTTSPYGTGVIPAGSVQPSQSILTNLFSGLSTIIPKIVSANTAANNVSNGYNANGTINLPDESQQEVNTLLPPVNFDSGAGSTGIVQPVTLQLPSIDTGSSSPTGADIADSDDFDFSDIYG